MDGVALALGGGALIGLASAVLLVVNGRILGVSGIADGALDRAIERWSRRGDRAEGDLGWRLALLGGLGAGAWSVSALIDGAAPRSGFPLWALIAGGVLVGYGTRLGNGCTSGHGICGVARGSRRSIVATGVFMSTAIATVWLTRHLLAVLP